jgi:uncharacterized protein YjiS (DUF1127 family)
MNTTLTMAARRQIPPSAGLLHGLRPALLYFVRRVTAARDRARTRRVLGWLDDAALKDIGLVRDQIEGVEHDPRYRRQPPGI